MYRWPLYLILMLVACNLISSYSHDDDDDDAW